MGDKAKKKSAADPKKAAPPPKPPPPPPKLNTGQVVMGESRTPYVVESILGKGGFGEVYKVHPLDEPDQKYALKVEDNNSTDPRRKAMLRLKVEILVFETIEDVRDLGQIDTTHFVQMLDKGKTVEFKYYVMDVIWKSLDEIVKICNYVMSPSTLIQIARQTLKALESFHEIGFLHRDIKPANYAVGLAPRDNVLYLLDFGICRPYREKNGTVMLARKYVQFLGTIRYASIRCHEYQEQSRRDDLEVWAYMMFELYDRKNLPWYNTRDAAVVLARKKELVVYARAMHEKGLLNIPVWYCDMLTTIFKMQYKDAGDFRFFNEMFAKVVAAGKIDETRPLDWAGKAPKGPPLKPRKKREKKKESKIIHKNGPPADAPLTEMQKEKLRRRQKEKRERERERSKERSKEEEARIDMDEEQCSEEEEEYSDEEEEDDRRGGGGGGRRRKKSRKRASHQRTRTRDEEYSDRDERDERRRQRRSHGGGGRKKISRKSRVSKKSRDDYRDDEDRVTRIPEPGEYRETKYIKKRGDDQYEDDERDEKKTPAKTPEVSPATKLPDAKKAAEAGPAKKDAVDDKKK